MSTSSERNTDRIFDKTMAARTCRVSAAGSVLQPAVYQDDQMRGRMEHGFSVSLKSRVTIVPT